ncbi:MAG: hypothetical protein ACTSPB_05510 [Candidatus Thorarchaeota archaeon]
MIEYMSQAKFAKLLGITPAAVCIAIKDGRLTKTVKGIDPRHPTNRYYMENLKAKLLTETQKKRVQRTKKKKEKQKKRTRSEIEADFADLLGEETPHDEEKSEKLSSKKQPSKTSDEEIQDLFGDEDGITGDFVRDKTSLDLEKSRQAVTKLQIANRKERNQLLPRHTIRNIFAQLYLIDVNELRTLGDKLATDAAAICSSDDPDCILAINQLIEKEVFRSLAHIQRIFNDYLIKYGADKLGKNLDNAS